MLLPYKFHTMLSLLYVIIGPKLKLIAHSHTEIWSFKVVHLDVCGSLVLSNPVTYVDEPGMYQCFVKTTHDCVLSDLFRVLVNPGQLVTPHAYISKCVHIRTTIIIQYIIVE